MSRGMNIEILYKQDSSVREASKRYYSLKESAEDKKHKLKVKLLKQWGRK